MKILIITILILNALTFAQTDCWAQNIHIRGSQATKSILIVAGVNEVLYHTGMAERNRIIFSIVISTAAGSINLKWDDMKYHSIGTTIGAGLFLFF